MVCGCEGCGTLMVHEERGKDSRCVCPACGLHCNICLGFDRPHTKEELARLFAGDFLLGEGKEERLEE